MVRSACLAFVLVALGLCRPATAQNAAAGQGIDDTFEGGAAGWLAYYKDGADDKTAPLNVTHKPAFVHGGQAALQFDYRIGPGGQRAAMRPVRQGDLAGIGTISLWVYADHQASLAVILAEAPGGGRYHAGFTVPRGTWQKVELAPSDFVIDASENDPKDLDGKLDMDQVVAIGITDLASILAVSPEYITLFGIPTGPHTLYVDDVECTPAKLPATTGLDDFARPQVNWAVLGSATVTRKTGSPIGEPFMQLDYQVAPARALALMHSLAPGALSGKHGISFSATAAKAVSLIVQIEDTAGGKFNTSINVPAGAKQTFHIAFNALKPSEDSKIQNGLAVDKVSQVLILDASGIPAAAPIDNVLSVGPISIE